MMKNVVVATNEWIISPDSEHLKRINTAGYNMVCWKRDALKTKQCFDLILTAQVEKLDTSCSYNDVAKTLQQHLSKSIPLTKLPDLDIWLSDVQFLATLFSEMSGSETLRLYFAVVENDMCRRFHTDVNDLRLLCTYHGPGTVCLNRNDLSENILDQAVTRPELISEDDIFRADTGDVVILKGALHSTSGGAGVLHRSPVLSGSLNKRIIIRLDTNSFIFSA